MRLAVVLGVLLVAGAAACVPGLVHPTEADVSWANEHGPPVTVEDLRLGRAAYVARCAGCHDLHRPEEYAADSWPALVAEMADEAKLASPDRERVVAFLRAASARVRGTTEPRTASGAGGP